MKKTINVKILNSSSEKHGQINIFKKDLSWIVGGRNSKHLKAYINGVKDDEEGDKIILKSTTTCLDKKIPLIVKFYDRGKNFKCVEISLLGFLAHHPEIDKKLSLMDKKDKIFPMSKQRIKDSKNNRVNIQFVIWLNKNPNYK